MKAEGFDVWVQVFVHRVEPLEIRGRFNGGLYLCDPEQCAWEPPIGAVISE